MKFVFNAILLTSFLLLPLNTYAGEDLEFKHEKIAPERACEAFKNMKDTLKEMNSNPYKNIIRGAVLSTALVSIGAEAFSAMAGKRLLRELAHTKGHVDLKKEFGLPERKLTDKEFDQYAKKLEVKEMRKALKKSAKKFFVVFAAMVALEQTNEYLKGQKGEKVIKDLLTELGGAFEGMISKAGEGSTMTAFFVQNPDEFINLDARLACAHLNDDEQSPKASPILRRFTVALDRTLGQHQSQVPESSDKKVNNSRTKSLNSTPIQINSNKQTQVFEN